MFFNWEWETLNIAKFLFNKPLKFLKVIFWNVFQIYVRTNVGKPVGFVNFFTNNESTGSTSSTWDFINGAVKNEVLVLILGFFGLKSGLQERKLSQITLKIPKLFFNQCPFLKS